MRNVGCRGALLWFRRVAALFTLRLPPPSYGRFYFGDFSVGGGPERFRRIVTCLAAEVRARRGDGCTCFVDTGVLDRDTLQFLVAAFAVDVVVDFGAPADVLDGATCRVMSGPVMAAARRRTAGDRRRARHEALQALFGDVLTEMVLPFDAVHLRGTDGRVAAPDGEGDALLHQVMGVSSAGAVAGVHGGEPLATTLAKVLRVDLIDRLLVIALPYNVSPASLPRPCRLSFGRMQWWS